MRNCFTQTDDLTIDAQIQTEQLKTLRPISSLFTSRSMEGEEETEVIFLFKKKKIFKLRMMKHLIQLVTFHLHQFPQNVVEVFIAEIIQCLIL